MLRIAGNDAAALRTLAKFLGDVAVGAFGGAQAGGFEGAVGVPDDDREVAEPLLLQSRRERGHGIPHRGQEGGARGEVFDGVPRERHFAEGQNVGTPFSRLPSGRDDLLGVAAKITDDGVGLSERQANPGHTQ